MPRTPAPAAVVNRRSAGALSGRRFGLAVAVAALGLTGTCTCDNAPTLPPLVLDNVPGAGEVRCGAVTKQSELIGGPQAFAQVGRSFRCNNANIRFIIQDASRPAGNSAEGGNLIDVDLARKDGSGEDTFREHVSAIGAKEIHVDKIEVIADGRAGGDGIIRVTGTPTALTLAPQAYYLSQDYQGRLQTDYILHPDVNYIEIVTTVFNDGPPIPSLQPADFVAFGGANRPHTPESGFGDVPLFSDVSFLAGTRGDKVSYAIVSADGDITIPFVDQGTTAPFYGTGVPVGSEHEFTRYFLVGDGSVESTSRLAMELKDLPRGTARGVVVDPEGAPTAGVLVAALSGALDADGTHVVNEARTAADGTWELTLAPGSYQLLAHAEGRARSSEVSVTVTQGRAKRAQPLTIGATGHVHVETSFTDRAGADIGTLPAKLTLVPTGDTQRASDVLADFSANGAVSYAVTRDGVFDADVPPGAYTAYVTRGFEFTRFEAPVVVDAGATATLQASIAHVLDTTGLIGAEFHQHCLGSIDAQVPVPRKVMENAAEGIELGASTDHDVITDFAPYVAAMGLEPYLSVIPGNEVSYQGIGHFNVYPWPIDPADPLRDVGSRMWWFKTVPEMFADVRAAAGDPIIQINHPRSQLTGYFASLTLDPTTASRIPRQPPSIPTFPATIYSDWAGDFDAMEVNGSLGDVNLFTEDGRAALAGLAHSNATNVPVLADYFALLGAGMKIVAMGNSDSHHIDGGVGYPRNFLTIGTDDPAVVTGDDAKRAIRAQQNAVGEGCLLELYVDGQRRQGIAQMITAADLDRVSVKLQAPPHVTPGALELFANGVARPLDVGPDAVVVDDAGALDAPVAAAAGSLTDDVARVNHPLSGLPTGEGDLLVVAVSKGGSGLAPTGGGSVFCYSAPLYVDVDGDGAFTPWLSDTQDVTP